MKSCNGFWNGKWINVNKQLKVYIRRMANKLQNKLYFIDDIFKEYESFFVFEVYFLDVLWRSLWIRAASCFHSASCLKHGSNVHTRRNLGAIRKALHVTMKKAATNKSGVLTSRELGADA